MLFVSNQALADAANNMRTTESKDRIYIPNVAARKNGWWERKGKTKAKAEALAARKDGKNNCHK